MATCRLACGCIFKLTRYNLLRSAMSGDKDSLTTSPASAHIIYSSLDDADETSSFVHQDGQPEPQKNPEETVIESEGTHILSTQPNGISKVSLYPNFLSIEDAALCFTTLLRELPWNQNSDKYGPQPRLTCWFGEHPYTYSGLTHEAHEQWHPLLLDIKAKLEKETGQTFNSVLCNLYRDNHDNVGWHCDDEPGLRRNPYIASVSLGEVRTFELRKKSLDQNRTFPMDITYWQHVRMQLLHGSLVVMEGSTQDDWQHQVPKEYKDKGSRINLTFRTIYPEITQ